MKFNRKQTLLAGLAGSLLIVGGTRIPETYNYALENYSPALCSIVNTRTARQVAPEVKDELEDYLGIEIQSIPEFDWRLDKETAEYAKIIKAKAVYIPGERKISFVGRTEEQFEKFGLGKKPIQSIREYVGHELGHDWFYEKLKKMEIEIPDPDGDFFERLAFVIADEGVASYFQSVIRKGKPYPTNVEFPRSIEEVNSFDNDNVELVYSWGSKLIMPILNRHRDKGLEYLVEHLPTKKDLFYLGEWQVKAMTELEFQDKNREDWEFIDLNKCINEHE